MAIKLCELAKGTVDIELDALAKCAGQIATNCYGVVGMAYRSKKDEFASLLKRDSLTKGIKVEVNEDKLNIDIHIIVDYGVNISAISTSIMNNVKYQLGKITGLEIESVDVFVEGFRVQE
ncbi:MAG: Asp23/Gls24 family envelope stress response protein [Ruminococcaceae bacterium]|nr:Asp23/Gls24 family envelope stress response protein [Oscillospiraceae bacterium]